MVTTTSYGTWCNRVSPYSTSPESDILDFINGGDSEWRRRVEETGAFERIADQYRAAINDALPANVSLCGDEFIGPYYDKDCDWEGELDIAEIVQAVDLGTIVEHWDPDVEWTRDETAQQIGVDPESVTKILSRWGVQPVRRAPGRGGQSIFNAYEVRVAQGARPGQGARTDLKDKQ
jgi:hypothetical protein